MHDIWHPPVIDPTNPIQPSYYPNVDEYLMAVNLANFIGATTQSTAPATATHPNNTTPNK
jgi:hypothetical protein